MYRRKAMIKAVNTHYNQVLIFLLRYYLNNIVYPVERRLDIETHNLI